jgi:hypothetical protein
MAASSALAAGVSTAALFAAGATSLGASASTGPAARVTTTIKLNTVISFDFMSDLPFVCAHGENDQWGDVVNGMVNNQI